MGTKNKVEEVFVITDHIFEDAISVIFTDNINESVEWQCKHWGINPVKYIIKDGESHAAVFYVKEPELRATWVIFDINNIDTGIIVHEIFHLVQDLLYKRDIKLSRATGEVFAYTNQWFFNKINNFWNEVKADKSGRIMVIPEK